MKKTNKKGFTIVELVIVIAVIGILSAVLIPTFSGLVAKAKYTNDTEVCAHMRTSLVFDFEAKTPANIVEAQTKTFKQTYANDLVPETSGLHYYWCELDNYVYLVNDSNSGFVINYPDTETKASVNASNSYRLDLEYCLLTGEVEGLTFSRNALVVGEENEVTITGASVPAKIKIGDEILNVTDGKFTVTPENTTSLAISQDTTVYVTGISLDKTELEITYGNSSTLTATIDPSDADNKNITWSSSDDTVATVSDGGLVTAVKVGTAVITVTTEDGSKIATCDVTVIKANYDMSGASWNYTGPFTFDDSIKQVTVIGLPSGVTVKTYKHSSAVFAGNYTASVTAFNYDSTNYNAPTIATLDWVINKTTQSAPEAPTENSKTNTSVTLNDIYTTGYGDIQYAYNTTDSAPSSGWQTSTTFTDLNENTTYYFFSRYEGNVNCDPAVSTGTAITTIGLVYTPLQQGTGDKKVNFLPAFDGTNVTLASVLGTAKICYKNGNVYQQIVSDEDAASSTYTMASLKSTILSYGIANVYVGGTPTGKFYGVYTGVTWGDAFGTVSTETTVYDFCDTFKTTLTNAGLSTTNVYTDTSGTGGTNAGNWDEHTTTMATLNGIAYSDYYNAYNDTNYFIGTGYPENIWTSKVGVNGVILLYNYMNALVPANPIGISPSFNTDYYSVILTLFA